VEAKVLLVHNFDELEQRKDDVRGKIVFYNYPFNPLFVETFAAYSDAVRYRGAGASRAAKYGAVGVLVRSMSESVDNVPHTGAMNYTDSLQKIPAAAVGLRDADRLAAFRDHRSSAKRGFAPFRRPYPVYRKRTEGTVYAFGEVHSGCARRLDKGTRKGRRQDSVPQRTWRLAQFRFRSVPGGQIR